MDKTGGGKWEDVADQLKKSRASWWQAYRGNSGAAAVFGLLYTAAALPSWILGEYVAWHFWVMGPGFLIGAFLGRDRLVYVPIWGLISDGQIVNLYAKSHLSPNAFINQNHMLSHYANEHPDKNFELMELGTCPSFLKRREIREAGLRALDARPF